jgi:hypothetical protein
MGDIAQKVCFSTRCGRSIPNSTVNAPCFLKKIPCYVLREFRPQPIVFARVGQGAKASN